MRSGGAPCAATSATAAVRDVVHSVPSTLYMFGHSVPVHVGLPLPGGCQTFVSRGPNGGHMDHNEAHSFGWQSVAHYLITTRWVFTSQI